MAYRGLQKCARKNELTSLCHETKKTNWDFIAENKKYSLKNRDTYLTLLF